MQQKSEQPYNFSVPFTPTRIYIIKVTKVSLFISRQAELWRGRLDWIHIGGLEKYPRSRRFQPPDDSYFERGAAEKLVKSRRTRFPFAGCASSWSRAHTGISRLLLCAFVSLLDSEESERVCNRKSIPSHTLRIPSARQRRSIFQQWSHPLRDDKKNCLRYQIFLSAPERERGRAVTFLKINKW